MEEFKAWVKRHTQARVAKRFGITQKAVSKWVCGQIPLARVRQVEAETGIPAWKLRPDTFRPERRVK